MFIAGTKREACEWVKLTANEHVARYCTGLRMVFALDAVSQLVGLGAEAVTQTTRQPSIISIQDG